MKKKFKCMMCLEEFDKPKEIVTTAGEYFGEDVVKEQFKEYKIEMNVCPYCGSNNFLENDDVLLKIVEKGTLKVDTNDKRRI